MNEFVYVDGRVVPREDAVVSAFDYGLLYGYGVFETMRVYKGRVFRLREHLERLERSGRAVGMEYDVGKVESAVRKLLAANGLEDACIRITVTHGRGKPRLAFGGRNKPSLFVFATRLPDGLEEKKSVGVKAGFSGIRHYSKSPLNGIKSTNYLLTALRKKEAQMRGLDDVIVLNEKDRVVEASTSNIFMAGKNNTLVTPRIEDGCLPGITRKTILEMAGKLGVNAVEKTIKPMELLKAKEVFITNSITEVVPVVRIDGMRIKKGALTGRLQEEYEKLAR